MSVETAFAALETAAPPAGSVPTAAPATPAPPTGTGVEEPKIPPVEGQPAPQETPEAPAGKPSEQPEEAEVNLEEVPEGSGDFDKYKEVLKAHPELAPELKQIIGREKAFSEMAPGGSFSDMKEILTAIPTVADAQQLVADSENKRLLGQTFREDLPTFVESLKESDPIAFQRAMQQLPEVLAQTDEALFSQQAKFYSDRVLNNLAVMVQNDPETFAAVQRVAAALGARLGQEPAPVQRDNEASRLRKQLQERDAADAEAAFDSFWSQTDQVVIDKSVEDIATSIKKALPTATEGQMKRMVQEAYGKTLELINAQPQTIAQINSYRESARKGRQGIADHKQIIDYITGRTKLVIPKAVKGVIDEWSGQVLKLNTQTIEKKKAVAAGTRDVGTGPQGTTSAAAPAVPNNGKPRHMSDILSELAAGTYVKR